METCLTLKNNIFKNKFVAWLMLLLVSLCAISPIMISQQIAKDTNYAFTEDGLTIGTDGKVEIPEYDGADGGAPWEKVITKYKKFIVGIGSVCTVTFIIFFILNITKLGASASNPTARSQALMGLVWTGIAAALLGTVTLWFGFFYKSLQKEGN